MNAAAGRFGLRQLVSGEEQWIYDACQDAEIQRWTEVPHPYRASHAAGFVRDGAGELAVWAIVENAGDEDEPPGDEDEQPVGVVSIHGIDPTGIASIGYWLAPWGRGRGAATAAVELLMEQLRAAPPDSPLSGVTAVHATIAETNAASRRTVERADFTLLPTTPDATCPDGDCKVQAVTYRRAL